MLYEQDDVANDLSLRHGMMQENNYVPKSTTSRVVSLKYGKLYVASQFGNFGRLVV